MDYDNDKIDDTVLALLYLTRTDDGARAWKGNDWNAMDRLHQKGFISNPRTKNKSVVMTPEGRAMSEKLFREFFAKPD
jgi:Domain of unknown function (DUF6429)